jgi:hypothetical protein
MNKTPVTHVGVTLPTHIPVIPAPWPAFPPAAKPSLQSPFRTMLWFCKPVNKGVRVIIEGRDKEAVDAYAKIISGAMGGGDA